MNHALSRFQIKEFGRGFLHTLCTSLGRLVSGRKPASRPQFLVDFASGMARDMEPPLRSLERFASEMHAITSPHQLSQIMPRIQAAGLAMQEISKSTQRYRLIACGPGVADDRMISIQELADFVLLFPSCQSHPACGRTLRLGFEQTRTMPQSLGRLVILVLCSTRNRLEGSLQGRLHALTFDDSRESWILTLVYFVQNHKRLQSEFQNLLVDLRLTLQAARASLELELPNNSRGPVSLILRPIDS
jgi:hypothetical protein